MTIPELRATLVDSGKFTEEEVNGIKGKALLEKLVEECVTSATEEEPDNLDEDADLEDLNWDEAFLEKEGESDEDENGEDMPVDLPKTPPYSSLEWPTYVLSQLRQDEMTPDGRPLVHGLRRLAEELLGEIVVNRPKRTYLGMDGYVCEWELIIAWKLNLPEYIDVNANLPQRIFGAAVDANLDGTPSPFKEHLASTADTQAEAKALRRALNLRVYAAEEINENGESVPDNTVLPEQINLIKGICHRLEIDVDKFLKHCEKPALEELTRKGAAELNMKLHKYQAGNNKEEIPVEILVEKKHE